MLLSSAEPELNQYSHASSATHIIDMENPSPTIMKTHVTIGVTDELLAISQYFKDTGKW